MKKTLSLFLLVTLFSCNVPDNDIIESTQEVTATDLEIVWCNAMVKKSLYEGQNFRRVWDQGSGEDTFLFLQELVINQIENEGTKFTDLSNNLYSSYIEYAPDPSITKEEIYQEFYKPEDFFQGYYMSLRIYYDVGDEGISEVKRTRIGYVLDFNLEKNKKLCKDWYSLAKDT